MIRTVATLKESVGGKLSGLDLNQVTDLDGAFETAARVFTQKAKIPETQIKQQMILYAGVFDYPADTRLFARSLIDIQPQGIVRQANDFVYVRFQDDFDRNKLWRNFGTKSTFDYNNGTPVIRIVSSYTPQQIILDQMNAITGWTAGGDANSLAVDSSFFYQTPGSLRFNLAAAGSNGYLQKTITPVNLTGYQGVGVIFLAIEVPDGEDITSIGVRIGSDSSNYYEVSNTLSQLGAFTDGQFMLIPLDLSLATTTGTPDITKIAFLRPFVNYNGNAQVNVRMGSLWISLPTPVTVIYSAATFFLAGGVTSNGITDDNDVIILNDTAYTIYEYECCIAVLEEAGGAGADSMIGRIEGKLNSTYTRTGKLMIEGLYDLYKADNPSEAIRNTGEWYDNSSPY